MTALIRGNEEVIDTLVQGLAADLPGVIADLNAADTKGVTLPDPAAVLDYVPTPTELVNFPTVAVHDGPTELHDDIRTGGTRVIELVVVVFCADADQRRLAIALRRYLRAVESVALDGRTLAPALGGKLAGHAARPDAGARRGAARVDELRRGGAQAPGRERARHLATRMADTALCPGPGAKLACGHDRTGSGDSTASHARECEGGAGDLREG